MARRRRTDHEAGAIAVEFVLILIVSLMLFAPVGEFLRLSLIDQTLARATHEVARAAGAAGPGGCEQAIVDAFQTDQAARWLFDRNEDGRVGVLRIDDWPDGSSDQEVQVTILADDDLTDSTSFEVVSACGDPGSWISVRARIVVRPWFGPLRPLWPDGIRRQFESWARNQS